MVSQYPGVSIIIPTLNGGEVFHQCLQMISKQQYEGPVQLIVVDSGSTDGTVAVAKASGAVLSQIRPEEFHHSRTRFEALRMASYENVVYLVQDAIPISEHWLANMVHAVDGNVVAAYGQQVPHLNADLYARFEVEFYRDHLGYETRIQSIADAKDFQALSYDESLHLIRFDNVCAIYRKSVLEQYPFPDVAYGEDIAWAKTAICNGYQVAYVPSIQVNHSHNRPAEYRFRRSLVESISCAKILNRIKRDLSYLKLADLYAISAVMEEISKQKHQMINQDGELEVNQRVVGYLGKVSQKFPFLKRIAWKCLRSLQGQSQGNLFLASIRQVLSSHVNYVLSLIQERFPEATKEELHDCIDQVIASMHGGLLGEVYASYQEKDRVPDDVVSFVAPYLKGV